MKKSFTVFKQVFVAVAALLLTIACNQKNTNHSQDIDFNKGWKFTKGEVSEAINPAYNDADWETVNVPHDWSIKGPFSKDNPSFSRGGWLPTGKCTYRKSFTVDANEKENKVFVYFDGAYRNSVVYINGNKVGYRPLGYIGFQYDLTEYINFDSENVLTVTLDNSAQPGHRWYSGTGIYRDVTLKIRNKTFIPNWSLYVTTPEITKEQATVNAVFNIQTEFAKTKNIVAKISAINNGSVVTSTEINQTVSLEKITEVKVDLAINNPKLWSPETPELYTVQVELFDNGVLVGKETTRTGIRSLGYSKDTGFSINGEQIKLKGVCLHHAGGPLGSAVYKRTIQRQLEILREMGCNAVRTSHNPFSTEFLDTCDEMGFLVMNEMFDEWEVVKNPTTVQDGKKVRIPVKYYADIFKEWADKDLTDFVLRDRNHPSVVMWSIGNEIDQMKTDEGVPIANRLIDIVHSLDDRPVTNGLIGYGWDAWPSEAAASTSDIRGYNYIKENGLDREDKIAPNAMGIVTECASAQSYYPRSTYLYGDDKKEWWDKLGYKYNDAYNWVEQRELIGFRGVQAWKDIKNRPDIMGQFIWTGWDYLGEVIPYGWPARSSSFAPIDLCGFPKDGYYFYQSQWSNKPMVHIFPHWNLEGQEGKKVTVYAYTNGDEVELFQDGKSLGKQKNDVNGVEYQQWEVVYQPGTLKAISYKNGKEFATKEVKTAGKAAKIELFARRANLKADGEDLSYIECTVLDKDGNVVPKAANLIQFEVQGAATLIGVGNGDNMNHDSFQASERKAFNGKCLAIIKTLEVAGGIKFVAKSIGLETATIEFTSK
ncbi:glycoside hydrolase family 2 TIM barrel-domain containing protein [Wenyingzhuangia aestuarii]|uniref:glycoside hydrolase family 2 TIM barrel-domain containing protein n=1 Tax=Wenyingzhuangia aestuarii TaxID=1647582 RepID=UPI001438ADF4|nr:glycoside hydrolase family 2 TIM barrel-domain containing protein [Wenyingzhuangia aestuarii]NJB83471.1 beta-galactosidase [Wenyingzhuangia aestuarii]